MRLCTIAVFVLSLLAIPAVAAPQNPELAAHVGENESGTARSEALAITTLDIGVAIDGDVARTTVTTSFANSSGSPLEGNFVFDLPQGSVVTGYALDVGGKMIDGVLVGRRQARLVYEQRVRRGVDPGLAEVTRSGAFMTRVFPILPGSGRTVRLTFDTPVEREISIPLRTEKDIGRVRIHVAGGAMPRFEGAVWKSDGDGVTAT